MGPHGCKLRGILHLLNPLKIQPRVKRRYSRVGPRVVCTTLFLHPRLLQRLPKGWGAGGLKWGGGRRRSSGSVNCSRHTQTDTLAWDGDGGWGVSNTCDWHESAGEVGTSWHRCSCVGAPHHYPPHKTPNVVVFRPSRAAA